MSGIKFVKTGADEWVAKIGNVEVGTITRSVEQHERPIAGTTLRHAAMRDVTVYRARLRRGAFVDAPIEVTFARVAHRALASAKRDISERVAGLALKG